MNTTGQELRNLANQIDSMGAWPSQPNSEDLLNAFDHFEAKVGQTLRHDSNGDIFLADPLPDLDFPLKSMPSLGKVLATSDDPELRRRAANILAVYPGEPIAVHVSVNELLDNIHSHPNAMDKEVGRAIEMLANTCPLGFSIAEMERLILSREIPYSNLSFICSNLVEQPELGYSQKKGKEFFLLFREILAKDLPDSIKQRVAVGILGINHRAIDFLHLPLEVLPDLSRRSQNALIRSSASCLESCLSYGHTFLDSYLDNIENIRATLRPLCSKYYRAQALLDWIDGPAAVFIEKLQGGVKDPILPPFPIGFDDFQAGKELRKKGENLGIIHTREINEPSYHFILNQGDIIIKADLAQAWELVNLAYYFSDYCEVGEHLAILATVVDLEDLQNSTSPRFRPRFSSTGSSSLASLLAEAGFPVHELIPDYMLEDLIHSDQP